MCAQSEALYQLKGSVEDQLKMRFFVHHNMDLEMMELKTSSGQYKSLEQLRGDAATVFHNVMLCFTGLFHCCLFCTNYFSQDKPCNQGAL